MQKNNHLEKLINFSPIIIEIVRYYQNKPLFSTINWEKITLESAQTAYDNIPLSEQFRALMGAAAQNIQFDPIYDQLAAAFKKEEIYYQVLGINSYQTKFEDIYQKKFIDYIQEQVKNGLLDKKLLKFDLEKLSKKLIIKNDDIFTYAGINTLAKRYLQQDRKQRLLETPQFLWLRVAMGMSYHEDNQEDIAENFYQKMSNLEYIPGGSTNINAGTARPRLSNCFLMSMEDDIDHIGKTVSDVMKLSKATGGIGLAVTKLRASGSPISTNNTTSSGPIPFLHIIDSTIRAISRAGKKMGALCFYLENWHLDFNEFIDLKQNAGDEYRRTRTANTAVYISDEFMKRVDRDDWWYLFDPQETSDLIDLYGEKFSLRYQEYIEKAESGNMRIFQKIKAKEQFRKIIVSLQNTSHPWITFKDAINVRALNDNTGTIYCSNLCTEITLPENKDNVSVCNLLSINLSKHLTENKQIDWPKLKSSITLGVRQLDNLVDINEAPIPEARNFDSQNRAIGLGIMGLAEIFEKLDLSYGSKEAAELTDKLFEFFSYEAILASANLAEQKGSYKNFSGSLWSKGLLPFDTIKRLESQREKLTTVNKEFSLDWESLRKKTSKGIRNSTIMAIAPTANIGLVAGTSTGIDPRFAQIFSRNTLSGKYLELNSNLVEELKEAGIWEQCQQQIISNYGDITNIEIIPDHIKEKYQDSFSIKPDAFLEVAARAQKWIDQAISRNLYLSTRDTDEIMAIYFKAWEIGLKTTYYLHLKPRHSAEQSTIKINKAEGIGKRGFGLVAKKEINENNAQPSSCPIDPQERLLCESCQ